MSEFGAAVGQRIYAGHMYDVATSLSYQGSRYYDPSTAKFLSQDPAFLAVGDRNALKALTKIDQEMYLANPQHLNSYSYAFNNPMVYRDPDGNFAFLIPVAVYASLNASWMVPAAIAWAGAATLAITVPLVGGQIASYAQGDYETGDRMGQAAMTTNLIAAAGIQGLMSVDSRALPSASSRSITVSDRNAQKGFTKHGGDFGLSGNWNSSKATEFRDAVNQHVNSEGVQAINGTYRGTMNVTHYYNPQSGLNVMVDKSGNYVGGWSLGESQAKNLLTNGNVQ